MTGVTNAFGTPSARAMAPEHVARADVPAAIALRTTANQIGIVARPAIGGLLLAVSAASVYAVATARFTGGLLGASDYGAAAALFGTIPAVGAGGAATIAVAALWTRLFPPLARLDRLDALQPEAVTL